MTKYIINVDNLRVGDVICTREDQPVSRLIRETLSCDYSHVLIYVAHSSCIHANSDGVHSINIQRMLFDAPNDVKVLRHKSTANMGTDDLERICEYPRSKVGTEYSRTDAVRAGIARKTKIKRKIDSKYQYCSRLVAESYAYASINIFDEPSLCTPADILTHEGFMSVNDVVRVAHPEEIEFAEDDLKNTISKQTKITNEIIHKAQVIFGGDIQTFGDIFSGVIKYPEHDDAIVNIIGESGYLTIWADDVLKCPYRYFKTNYQDRSVIESLRIDGLHSELGLAEKDIKRFNAERLKLVDLHTQFPRKTLHQQINLYQILVSIAIQRKELFLWLLKEKEEVND